jgi:diguanylate cyclase (GGDEF)-like protein/PAS domain S-box-containing protein
MQVIDRTELASAQGPARSRGKRRIAPRKAARPAPPGGKKARQASDIPYRRLFETGPDGMLLINASTGRVMQVNRALTELSGYRAPEIRGKKLWEIPPLRATDAGLVVFRELQKQKRIYYDDLPFATKEGRLITVELICSMHDMNGAKLIQCTIRDVTRHKQVKDELWNAEARFQAVFRQAGIGIALLDREGRFVDGNARLCGILGYEAKELGTLTCTGITHPDGQAAHAELFRELREGKRDSYHLAQRCVRKDGAGFWALITVSAVRGAGGTPRFMTLTMEDITERKRAEETVINSRDFYRSLIFELPNPIRITDTDAKCDYVSKAWLEFTGRRLDQEVGEGWAGGVHPEDLQRVREICAVSFRNRSPYVTEYRLAHRSGEYRWLVEFGRPFNDIDGTFAGYISSCYDVHERKVFEDRLHSISFTDDLTGLLNRRGFFTFAQQQLKQANRSRKGFLFLYADLDGLKTINDTFGHQEGDLALVEATHILREVFRESDIIARLGGDEFAVLMPENSGAGDEAAIVKRLHESIAEHNAQPGRRFTLSMSAGIKQYDPANPCTLDELISRADRLMYREKKSKQAR